MKRLTVLVAGIAAVMTLGAGLGQAGPTPVVCGQIITTSTHVGNDLLNCPVTASSLARATSSSTSATT